MRSLPPQTTIRPFGPYGRFAPQAPAGAGVQPLGTFPVDGFLASQTDPLPQAAPATPAAVGDFVRQVWDWLRRLLQPTPLPPVPTPSPTPVPEPTPGGGPQAFFTDAYASPLTGLTNEQVRAANQASTQADPASPDKQLAALIDAVPAGGTLDGAFFSISVPSVVDALARASRRGVRVRLVTEQDYYATPDDTEVREPIQTLLAAGVQIRPDDREGGLMHDKFLIANGTTVWTGSYNITEGGSYEENNNALRFDSPELASQFQAEFDKMFVQGNFGADDGVANHPTPRTVQIGNAQVTTYFSPSSASQAGAKGAIMQELAGAQKSIEFLAFSFTDDEMGALMAQKAQAGVKVQGIFEKSQAASRYSEYNTLNPQEAASGGNLDVRIDTNPALMHHKVIIVDDATLIVGSANFSASAQADNNENMLVIKNAPDLVQRYKEEFARIQAISA